MDTEAVTDRKKNLGPRLRGDDKRLPYFAVAFARSTMRA
jgi:hypothetical protein